MSKSANPNAANRAARLPNPVRLTVASLASGGDGVAHLEAGGERRAVFVPRAAPGDEIEASVDWSHKPARATSYQLLRASDVRVTPACPAVHVCGGCDWMHLSRQAQEDARVAQVHAAIERAVPGPLPEIRSYEADAVERYRTRARFAVEARGKRVEVGYREARGRHIADVRSCLVLDSRLEPVLADLAELLEGERGAGEVAASLGRDGKPVIDLRWEGNELSPALYARVEAMASGGRWAGATVWLTGARRPAIFGDPAGVTIGGDGEPLRVPSAGFAQAQPTMSQRLVARALEHLAGDGQQVLELFSGSGNFTVAVARRAANVIAVEADAAAAEMARANLAARGLAPRVRVVCADADAYDVPAAARSVLLDPPRAGAVGAVTRLAVSKVRRVVYVSCDPSTLARDLTTLCKGPFRLTALETFDMFPHTSHVEVLVALDRRPR